MITSRHALIAGLLLAATPTHAGALCKWVDEQGTVHYAERCPESVKGAAVTLDPGPSAEERAAAEARSRALAEAVRPAAQGADPATEPAVPPEPQNALATLADCERVRREREILELSLPVYRTPDDALHYRDALHHHWYAGERRYLDDSERARELETAERFIANECVGIGPGRPTYVFRFRRPPPLNEVLDMLADLGQPWVPPEEEVCTYAKRLQRDLIELNTGVPSDEQRALNDAIRQRCR